MDTLRLREVMGAGTRLPLGVLTHRNLVATREDTELPLAVMELPLVDMEHLLAVDMHLPRGDMVGMDLPQERDQSALPRAATLRLRWETWETLDLHQSDQFLIR